MDLLLNSHIYIYVDIFIRILNHMKLILLQAVYCKLQQGKGQDPQECPWVTYGTYRKSGRAKVQTAKQHQQPAAEWVLITHATVAHPCMRRCEWSQLWYALGIHSFRCCCCCRILSSPWLCHNDRKIHRKRHKKTQNFSRHASREWPSSVSLIVSPRKRKMTTKAMHDSVPSACKMSRSVQAPTF